MLKIDLHIHTVKNEYLDRAFSFDEEAMETYVSSNSLDIVAITNHNLFDKSNFEKVKDCLSSIDCLVLPGIEISLETGHILLIFNDTPESISTLQSISSFLKTNENDCHYKMSVRDFNNLCCGHDAIIIPHYDKSPKISKAIINQINDPVNVGEVDSPKKFYKNKKTPNEYTPVYFSDIRIGEADELEDYRNKSRFTYIDCDSKSFNSLKTAFKNNSTFISKNKIPEEFDILNGTATASTGINVLIGKRSSGKSYTLNHVSENLADNCLYIRQFEITQDCTDDAFKDTVKESEKRIVLDYVKEINIAFDILEQASADELSALFGTYFKSLKECADEQIIDIYSKCNLYNFSNLQKLSVADCDNLIQAVETLLNAKDKYKQIVENAIDRKNLVKLYCELINRKKRIAYCNKTIEITNKICNQISSLLGQESSAKQIKRFDIVSFFESLCVKDRFDNLISSIDNKIVEEDLIFSKFKKKTVLYKQKDKRSWKSDLGVGSNYNIEYLSSLSPSEAYLKYISDTSITKKLVGDNRYIVFFRTDTEVHNDNDKEISGGQKAEYILLRKLSDYKMYDIILIDEMESSFDNPFLNTEVVSKIKMIGQTSTVFVSTHNNNLGVSLNPNYYIYHEVKNENGNIEFKHYCGKANDEFLVCPVDGTKEKLSKVLLDTMEANKDAYSERKDKYDIT